MILENRIDMAIIGEHIKNPVLGFAGKEAREASDDEFMKKNNITHQSHEQRDKGIDISDNTCVTVWVPR